MRCTVLVAALFAAPGLSFAGAGHEGGHGHGSSATGKPGAESEVSRTIEVGMTDNRYDRERIEVREGETVRFVVHNRGNLVHEFNIGTPKMHAAHQQEMLEMMRSGAMTPTAMGDEHGHAAMKGHDDANSVLLDPGESSEFIWSFTRHAENLEFACNVPGHYQAGMIGHFRLH